ncbi:DUF305 domain-containing protein [Streptomyces sp. B1I3]|uniref:DUF305 domain-containing protein n=1 Tax=Streptomyces sp. B1I3 TaxID=3042264 RepID=UPI0027829487|nr:DUF305 domain-containing protein [Streptomyces sp. B1I3]MDQ0792897.1 uncharacterized protein (DUF305 family) [Streptomyces sp. B1I3]
MKAASHLPASILVPLLLLLTAATSCSAGPEAVPGAGPRTGAHAPSTPGTGNPTDSAWVQLMVPMDERALSLLALAAHRTADPRLRPWAAGLRTALAAELTALRHLRDRMGLPDTDVHEGHDMPGMVTDTDLERARTTVGAPFDRLLVDQVREHLRQSQQVSRSETAAGGDAEARERARALVAARRDQLAALAELPAPRPPGQGAGV